ncbi:MAG TPA: hypothetical protein VMW52_08505 [Phycisphaerae bacterium]|nr:hypothetical protein [Phycisphaerae bacterium]
MSEFEQTEDPRVLESIDANEISLVDTPAILRTFLVVKRLEDGMARKQIALEDEQEASDEEKAAEGAVAQDASQADIKTDTASGGDDHAEKADPAAVMESASDLLPWLVAQFEDADGELKGQISAFLEALGVDATAAGEAEAETEAEPEAKAAPKAKAPKAPAAADEEDDEEDDTEKANEGWESRLSAVTASLTADVAKAEGEEEEEDDTEKAEGSSYVTNEQFEAFATKMTDAIAGVATSMQAVSKRAAKLDSFTPVSKGADDHTKAETEVAKGSGDGKIFSGLFNK